MRKKPDRKWLAVLAVLAGMAWAAGPASSAGSSALHKVVADAMSFTAGAH